MQMATFIPVLIAVRLASAAQMPASESEAMQHSDAGSRAFTAGDYVAAIKEYATAYKLSGQPEMLLNLGQAYEQNDDLKRAEKSYETVAAWPDCRRSDGSCRRLASAASDRLQYVRGRISEKGYGPWLPPPPPNIYVMQSMAATVAPSLSEPAVSAPAVSAAPPFYRRPAARTVSSIGIATVAVGAVLLGESAVADGAARGATMLADQRQHWSDGGTFQTAGIATIAAGGAAIIIGGVLFALKK